MKKILLILNFSFLVFNSFSQAPPWLWAKGVGGPGTDYAQSLAIDASGNVYTAGAFRDTVDFDPGPGIFNLASAGGTEIFVSKLDASGNFIWAKQMGGIADDFSWDIAIDSLCNIYITGYFEGTADFDPEAGTFNLTSAGMRDIFISKLDSAGNFLWAKQMAGAGFDSGNSITVDASGNVYSTGWFEGTVDFDPGGGTFNLTSAGFANIFVSKLDSSGNFLWAKQMGGTSADQGFSIAIDSVGSRDVYITGRFNGTADFDPGASTFNLTSAGSSDIFICKLDSSGNFVWAKAIGGAFGDYGYSVAINPTGSKEVYTTGRFSGTVDFDPGTGVFNLTSSSSADIFISKLDSVGNFGWAKLMGGTFGNLGSYLTIDASRNVYTTGEFSGTADFDPGIGIFNLSSVGSFDMFVSKLDSSGNFVWAKSAGGTDVDYGWGIALDVLGKVHVAGRFANSSITFGSTTLTNAGSSDMFITKIDTATIMTGNDTVWPSNSMTNISPNPFTTQATINFSKEVYNATFSLYNLLGEKVAEISGINGESFQINRGNLRSGVYVFEVSEGKSIWRGKAVAY